MDNVDVVGVDAGGREIRYVEGHDGGGVGADRRGEDVAVFGVAGHRVHGSVVAGDLSLGEGALHLGVEIVDGVAADPYLQEVPVEFGEDVSGPQRLV